MLRKVNEFLRAHESNEIHIVRVVFGHHMRVGFCLSAIELARAMRKIPHFRDGDHLRSDPHEFPGFLN